MFFGAAGYQRTADIKRPSLDGSPAPIDQWSTRRSEPSPQTAGTTAKRIFVTATGPKQRLQGATRRSKNYVREHGRRSREMFVSAAHNPPPRPSGNFGEADGVIGGV